jgi:hypothetical protein
LLHEFAMVGIINHPIIKAEIYAMCPKG